MSMELEEIVYKDDGSEAMVRMRINGQLVEGNSENYLKIHPEYRKFVGKDRRDAAVFAVRDAVMSSCGVDIKSPEWTAKGNFSDQYEVGKGEVTVTLVNGQSQFQATVPDKRFDSIVFAYAAAMGKMLEHKKTH